MRPNSMEHREANVNEGRGLAIAEHVRHRVAESLEHIAQVANAQHKRGQQFTTTETGSLGAAGPLFTALHLGEESAIASAYVENNGTIANLLIYEGSGNAGRLLSKVKPGTFKRIALADHISTLSISSDANDSGLVVATLTTKNWSPASGSA